MKKQERSRTRYEKKIGKTEREKDDDRENRTARKGE